MIEPVNTSKQKKYIALQALRALAAALVIYVHALGAYGENINATFISATSYDLGELGVKIFFCISGFIIFNSSKKMKPGLNSFSLFLRRRFIRVAPIYWIVTLLYALKLYVHGNPATYAEFFKSVLFIPYSNDSGLMRPILLQGWTLNYEMFFYTLFGFGLLISKTNRFFMIFGILISLTLFRHFEIISYGGHAIENILFLLAENFLMYFLLGLLIGLLNEKGLLTFKGLNETQKIFAIFSVLAIYIFLRIFIFIPPLWVELAFALVCFVSLVICILNNASNQGVSSHRNIFNRIVELAGDASYSTYLTHAFLMGPIIRAVKWMDFNMSLQIFITITISVCTIFGIFFFKFIEAPVLSFLNSKFAKI